MAPLPGLSPRCRRRFPQPGMSKAGSLNCPVSQARTTSARSPATNGTTLIPRAETIWSTGHEMAPHTSVSTLSSDSRATPPRASSVGSHSSVCATGCPASASTTRTCLATSHTGAMRLSQHEKPVLVTSPSPAPVFPVYAIAVPRLPVTPPRLQFRHPAGHADRPPHAIDLEALHGRYCSDSRRMPFCADAVRRRVRPSCAGSSRPRRLTRRKSVVL